MSSSDTPSRMSKVVNSLVNLRWILLAVTAALLCIYWPVASRLTFDQSIESLYADNNPHLQDYLQSKNLFGGDEFVIIACRDEQLFEDPDSLALSEQAIERIESITLDLKAIPGIQPDSIQELVSVLDFKHTRKRVTRLIEGILVGEDRQANAIVLRLEPEQTAPVPRSETLNRIRQLAEEQPLQTFVVGEPVQIQEMYRYVEEDGRTLFYVSLALLSLVLLIFFRSLRWVLLPVFICLFATKGTQALLVMGEAKLSMVSSMLNSLVTIIGVATVTHIAVNYRSQRNRLEPVPALTQSLRQLLPPIFWTCLTTAIGFGALISSQINPVQSFGLMVSLATFLVFLAVIGAIPGGVLLAQRKTEPLQPTARSSAISTLLKRQSDLLEAYPRTVLVTTIGLFALALLGFTKLKVETDFSKNFRKTSPIIQSLMFVESHLGGAGNWEVNFPAPAELDEDFLERVRKVSSQLRALELENGEKLTKVISLSDGVDSIPKIPFIGNTLTKRLHLLNGFQHDFQKSLYNPEGGRMRIVLRAIERQDSDSKLNLIHAVQKIVEDEFTEAKTTGLFVLLTYLIESLLGDQLLSFLLAGAGIFLMISLAFRSFWIGLIALVPNLLPIVLVIGIMGWTGLPVNIATAMIASVSMGLTVDSTVHYINSWKRHRQAGDSHSDAIQATHQSTGRALVFANLALVVGFSVLSLSHFIPLVYFGLLISLAMLGGLLGNLFLLPMLLKAIDSTEEAETDQDAMPLTVSSSVDRPVGM